MRPVSESDLSSLAVLAEEFMPGEADTERRVDILTYNLRNPAYELLVAETEGRIVGFIDQWFMQDFVHGGKLSYIQNFYVTPQHRGKGVGGRLLQETIRRAEAKGVLEVHVSTEFGNEPAIDIYKKHGFVKEHLQLEMNLNE